MERGNGVNNAESRNWEEFHGISSFCSDYGVSGYDSSFAGCIFPEYQQQEQESFLLSSLFDDPSCRFPSPQVLTFQEQTGEINEIKNGIGDAVEQKKSKQIPGSSTSLGPLNDYCKGCERSLKPRKPQVKEKDWELSTEEIMRTARARFTQYCTLNVYTTSNLDNLFQLSFSGHNSDEEAKNVALAELLLASAEKVANRQFDCAIRLLSQCDLFSSNNGNPAQRVVYYFAEALRKRIDKEKGTTTSYFMEDGVSLDIDEAVTIPNSTAKACHEVPFFQAPQYAAVQAISENVETAKKVHVIDFQIRNGLQWTILMQDLASRKGCPLELLKITAVGTTSRKSIEDTGDRLMNFAKSMDLPFSFKIVMVSDILHLKEDMFELEPDEVVAAYSAHWLQGLIVQPDRLESVMRVIKGINPCIMVLIETESNHNSTVFMKRFIGKLLFVSALFDCFEACLQRKDSSRAIMEALYVGDGIRNTVACEGEERNVRHAKIGVWRKFFSQFGMVAEELSKSSRYQVDLIFKKFPCGRYCETYMDRKSLLLGWKGTPIVSVSTWKFIPVGNKS